MEEWSDLCLGLKPYLEVAGDELLQQTGKSSGKTNHALGLVGVIVDMWPDSGRQLQETTGYLLFKIAYRAAMSLSLDFQSHPLLQTPKWMNPGGSWGEH